MFQRFQSDGYVDSDYDFRNAADVGKISAVQRVANMSPLFNKVGKKEMVTNDLPV